LDRQAFPAPRKAVESACPHLDNSAKNVLHKRALPFAGATTMKTCWIGFAMMLLTAGTIAVNAQNGKGGDPKEKTGEIRIYKLTNGKFQARIVDAQDKAVAQCFPVASRTREDCLKGVREFKTALESHKAEDLIELQKNGAYAFKIASANGETLGILLPNSYFTKDECLKALDNLKAILKTTTPGPTIEKK
jgi:uncharacterized protein YegP (UPF0339 family)